MVNSEEKPNGEKKMSRGEKQVSRQRRRMEFDEDLRDRFVSLRTDYGEIYAVAVRANDTEYHIGFAVCMPEDRQLPRRHRAMKGYWKAKRRALRSNSSLDVPVGEKVYPLLKQTAVYRTILEINAAQVFAPVGEHFGFAAYHGRNARLVALLQGKFGDAFMQRYAPNIWKELHRERR